MRRASATFFVDTSCIIAAVCGWHTRHADAAAEIERRLGVREKQATAAHAIAEAYAVLTRIPAPHRLSPAEALTLLESNFIAGTRVVALDAAGYRSLPKRAALEGITGGRTYDAVIGECALKAKAVVLLTFNVGHFSRLAVEGVRIVVPGAEAAH